MKKLTISPIGELIRADDSSEISRAVDYLIEFADEARPVEQWAFAPDDPNEDDTWPVLQSDYRQNAAKTLSTHPTKEIAEAEAERINKLLFDNLAASLDTVEVPEDIDPADISIGPVEIGTRPRERRCSLHIGDTEILVHWETAHVGDHHLNTARIKAEIEKHFAKFAESANA